MSRINSGRIFSASILLQLAVAVCAFAQASVNPKGTGTISLSYQNVFVDNHLFGKGQNFGNQVDPITGRPATELGEIRTHAMFFNVEYSITDQLAISGAIPYITSRYEGRFPHYYHDPGQLPSPTDDIIITNPDGSPYLPVDDGDFHGAFQDISLRLRYNVFTDPLIVTPFIEYSAPTHGYEYFAHAVVGSRVAEFKVGTYLAHSMPFLLNAYIQGRYAFGFSQRIQGISRTRHHAELEVGYSITDRIGAFGVILGQVTNGGLNLPEDFGPLPNRSYNPKFYHHLQISRDNLLDVGAGLQYFLNDRMALFGVLLHTITARNMHAINYGITFGISWSFGSSPLRPCNC